MANDQAVQQKEHVSNLRQHLVDQSVSDVVKNDKAVIKDEVELVKRVHQEFINKQIRMFPKYCQHAYRVNYEQKKQQEDYGIKGKYTDSYGWSKDGSMKMTWTVPMELQIFMQNMVRKDFWEDSNKKVRDAFMLAVCRGGSDYDYEQLLKKMILLGNDEQLQKRYGLKWG